MRRRHAGGLHRAPAQPQLRALLPQPHHHRRAPRHGGAARPRSHLRQQVGRQHLGLGYELFVSQLWAWMCMRRLRVCDGRCVWRWVGMPLRVPAVLRARTSARAHRAFAGGHKRVRARGEPPPPLPRPLAPLPPLAPRDVAVGEELTYDYRFAGEGAQRPPIRRARGRACAKKGAAREKRGLALVALVVAKVAKARNGAPPRAIGNSCATSVPSTRNGRQPSFASCPINCLHAQSRVAAAPGPLRLTPSGEEKLPCNCGAPTCRQVGLVRMGWWEARGTFGGTLVCSPLAANLAPAPQASTPGLGHSPAPGQGSLGWVSWWHGSGCLVKVESF